MNKSLQALLMFSLLIYLSTVGLFQLICGLVLIAVLEIVEYIMIRKTSDKLKNILSILQTINESLEKDDKATKKKTTKNKKKGE